MIFKRQRTRENILNDYFVNGFQKTGFINEHLMNTRDRDFWLSFKDMLTDINTSSVFDTMMVGWQEVPYNEAVLSRAILGEYKDSELHKIDGKVFASTSILNCRIYRCLFIHSPMNISNANKEIEILNTINMIDNVYRREFHIVDHVYNFLIRQSKLHTANSEKEIMKDLTLKSDDLFIKDIVTIIVPELVDNSYYVVNGIKRYPCISENYHTAKSQLGQTKLTFKAKTTVKSKRKKGEEKSKSAPRKRTEKWVAYFDIGKYLDDETGELLDIFYIKFFSNWVNPFFIFDKEEIISLMEELSEYEIGEDIRKVLNNNFNLYMRDLDKIRETYKNGVPYIKIYKENDSYYDEIEETSPIDDLTADGDEDADLEVEAKINEIEEQLDDEDVEEDRKFVASRHVISISTLKSLILGHADKLYLGFYSRLADNLLKITDINSSGYGKDRGISSKQAPRTLQVIKTISSNPDLFVSNTNTNPIDVWLKINYRKFIHERDTSPAGKAGGKTPVPLRERFLDFEKTYGLIDPTTTKSETSSGLAGNVSIMDYYSEYFEYKYDRKDK